MFRDIKAVIFDIDGTIMDSIGRICECMEYACVETGLKAPTKEATKEIIGLTLDEAVETLFPGKNAEQINKTVELYKQVYTERENEHPTSLFTDCISVVTDLKQKGYRIGIATGKSRKGYNRIMSYIGLKDLVDVSCTGDEVRSKPDPQMLLRLSDELLLPPKACLMVGDSTLDLTMAQRAMMESAGVTTGVHSRARLETIKPTVITDSLTELDQLLPGCKK